MKIYGAAYQGLPDPSPELMEAAKEIARSHFLELFDFYSSVKI